MTTKATNSKKKDQKKKCGIIMPIASNSDYQKEHWKEVLAILVEAINETEFEARLVSDDVAIGLIHERIVNNIYTDEIVICDVSSKNPNVMFELGLRLAFDKPTIIIKDEKTGYSFDTGVIEHLNYPSSLRFNKIVDFKQELIKKINATYKKSIDEPEYSPFLKSFGRTIVPSKIEGSEISENKYILSKLEDIGNDLRVLSRDNKPRNSQEFSYKILSNPSTKDQIDQYNIAEFEFEELIIGHAKNNSIKSAKALEKKIKSRLLNLIDSKPNINVILDSENLLSRLTKQMRIIESGLE